MEAMFQKHHPKNSLMLGRGLFSKFFAVLKNEFGDKYLDPVLLLVTKIFTRFRQRAINYRARMAKKQKKERKTFAKKKAEKEQAKKNKTTRTRIPDSNRGKRKLAEVTYNR